jgi:hypothetical protein
MAGPVGPPSAQAEAAEALEAFVRRLRMAYAGELGAARAYAGHWRSIRRGRPGGEAQRQAIRRIQAEEMDHRAQVGAMLRALGHEPGRLRDAAFWCIGTAIAGSCFAGGWYAPMHGAGRIERRNIWEYEDAARLAVRSGRPEWVEPLLAMAEVEWDHERFFHDHARSHWLHARLRGWASPPPREEIRASFQRGEPAPRPKPARPRRERRGVPLPLP